MAATKDHSGAGRDPAEQSTELEALGVRAISGTPDGANRRVLVVVSRFNREITDRLLQNAVRGLLDYGVGENDIVVVTVPGAWELAGAARFATAKGEYDAVVALGCVIRGETPHFDYVAGEAARGLAMLDADLDIPVVFGVLTTDTAEQARARAGGGHGDKGREAAAAALEMAAVYRQIDE